MKNRKGTSSAIAPLALMGILWNPVMAFDYPVAPASPQPKGWPLTEEEMAYNLKPEYERRPSKDGKFTPEFWPSVPFAQFWGGPAYVEHHNNMVKMVRAQKGPCDVLLVGDSITIQFEKDLKGSENWKLQFPEYKAVNIGVGGDRTSSVLWRLDHGGADGLEPRSIVLMIGNNNMFFAPETGTTPIAKGIEVCVDRLRDQFPKTPIILVKILPCGSKDDAFYKNIVATNAALDPLNIDKKNNVKVLDIWKEFVREDGSLKEELFMADKIHPNKAGYEVYAKHLRPLLKEVLK